MTTEIVSLTNDIFTLKADDPASFIPLPPNVSITALRSYFKKEAKLMKENLGFPEYGIEITEGKIYLVTPSSLEINSSEVELEVPVNPQVQAALDALQAGKKIKIRDANFRRSLYRGANKIGIYIQSTAVPEEENCWIFFVPRNADGSNCMFEIVSD